MRSSMITLMLAIAALAFTSGCVSFSSVSYPGRSPADQPENIRIRTPDDKRELLVALVLHTTNSQAIAVSPSESFLVDEKGRHYNLQFTRPARDGYAVGGTYWSWYRVQAYGTLPSAPQLTFAKGSYDISVEYTLDGDRRVAQTAFVVDRRSVPFLLLWFSLLVHPVGPCG